MGHVLISKIRHLSWRMTGCMTEIKHYHTLRRHFSLTVPASPFQGNKRDVPVPLRKNRYRDSQKDSHWKAPLEVSSPSLCPQPANSKAS